jgi:lysophospholipase L1-like esterase
VRIVCVGASTTFDILAKSDDATWPAQLERRLQAKHPEVEVVNTGVPGRTIDYYLAPAAWQEIASLSPDVIVVYFATNEISHEAQARFDVARLQCTQCPFEVAKGEGEPPASCPRCGAPLVLHDPRRAPEAAGRALKAITDWSLFAYKVWLAAQTTKPGPEHVGAHELPAEAASAFEQKLRELVSRTRAVGAKPALGTFALRWRSEQPLEQKRDLAKGAFGIYVGLSLEGIDRAFEGYNGAIRRVARDDHDVVLPLSEELSGKPELFGDFLHFSAAGSERVAEIVGRELEESGALERR